MKTERKKKRERDRAGAQPPLLFSAGLRNSRIFGVVHAHTHTHTITRALTHSHADLLMVVQESEREFKKEREREVENSPFQPLSVDYLTMMAPANREVTED